MMHPQHLAPSAKMRVQVEALESQMRRSVFKPYSKGRAWPMLSVGNTPVFLTSEAGMAGRAVKSNPETQHRRQQCQRLQKPWQPSGLSQLYPHVQAAKQKKNMSLSTPSRSRLSRHIPVNTSKPRAYPTTTGQAFAPALTLLNREAV